MADSNGSSEHERAAIVVQALTEKGALRDCPMCEKGTFAILPSFVSHFLADDAREASDFEGERRFLPCVVLSCRNCGFTAQLALEPLGLMHLFDK